MQSAELLTLVEARPFRVEIACLLDSKLGRESSKCHRLSDPFSPSKDKPTLLAVLRLIKRTFGILRVYQSVPIITAQLTAVSHLFMDLVDLGLVHKPSGPLVLISPYHIVSDLLITPGISKFELGKFHFTSLLVPALILRQTQCLQGHQRRFELYLSEGALLALFFPGGLDMAA